MAAQTGRSETPDGRPVRIAHLVSHPIQYFAPLYREIAARPQVELTVYFLSDVSLREYHDTGFDRRIDWDVDLTAGYRAVISKDAQGRSSQGGLRQLPHWRVLRDIATQPYDVLWIHGYNHMSLAAAIALGRLRRVRVMVREEQTLLENRPLYKQTLKEIALRGLFANIDGLYLGEESRRFFRLFGVPDGRLFKVPYAANSTYLADRAISLAGQRATLRRSLGINDEAPIILFVGKLIPRKDPVGLLHAFKKIVGNGRCWLLYAGDGEEREALNAEVRRSGIPNVVMTGFVNQTALPEIYAAADVFVLPSTYNETWGIVVNEAMTFGLPVVLSDHVGSSTDLVRSGWNGFVTRAGDVDNMAEALGTLVADPSLRKEFGQNSRALIGGYSLEAAADALIAATLSS